MLLGNYIPSPCIQVTEGEIYDNMGSVSRLTRGLEQRDLCIHTA